MPTKVVTLPLERRFPQQVENAEAYDAVWAIVMRDGVPLGHAIIENQRTPILEEQLRSEIVRQLSSVILDRQDYKQAHSFARAAGKAQRQIPSAFASQPELANLLPKLKPRPGARFHLSIVVCTHDRPDDLRLCLNTLIDLDPGRHLLEIIVVDNNPASGITKKLLDDFPTIRYEIESRKGVAYARNKGLRSANGDIVAYIDDDVVAPPQWASRILAPFADERVMCVSGLVLPLELESQSQEMFEQYGALGRGYRPRIFDERFFNLSEKYVVHTWELGGTANVAIRKCAIQQTGMFDETLGPGLPTGVGEDIYMFYRLLKSGLFCYYEPAAYVWHKHRASMKALRRQLYNYNKGQTSYQLRTLVTDGDKRVIRQLLWELPKWHLWRLFKILMGRLDYPLHLVLIEIGGNLVGPFAFYQSVRMHRRLNGPNTNPIRSVHD